MNDTHPYEPARAPRNVNPEARMCFALQPSSHIILWGNVTELLLPPVLFNFLVFLFSNFLRDIIFIIAKNVFVIRISFHKFLRFEL